MSFTKLTFTTDGHHTTRLTERLITEHRLSVGHNLRLPQDLSLAEVNHIGSRDFVFGPGVDEHSSRGLDLSVLFIRPVDYNPALSRVLADAMLYEMVVVLVGDECGHQFCTYHCRALLWSSSISNL